MGSFSQLPTCETLKSELPFVYTLTVIAACAEKESYEEEKVIPDKIEIGIDMVTALLIRQHTKENRMVFLKSSLYGVALEASSGNMPFPPLF